MGGTESSKRGTEEDRAKGSPGAAGAPHPPAAGGPSQGLVHSQLLQASVELHVHGVQRMETSPVLYVSAGERKDRVQVGWGPQERFCL